MRLEAVPGITNDQLAYFDKCLSLKCQDECEPEKLEGCLKEALSNNVPVRHLKWSFLGGIVKTFTFIAKHQKEIIAIASVIAAAVQTIIT
ncbi:unnamed protein product, partial [Mesorhabditis spiculigera]